MLGWILVLLIGASLVAAPWLFLWRRLARLGRLAAERGLAFRSRWGLSAELSGRWQGRVVHVTTEHLRALGSIGAFTRSRTAIRFGLPPGLRIVGIDDHPGLVGPDGDAFLRIGDGRLDAAIRVQTDDPALARQLLGRERFADAVLALVRSSDLVRIDRGQLELILQRRSTDEVTLAALLDRLVQGAGVLEAALRWHPGQGPLPASPARRVRRRPALAPSAPPAAAAGEPAVARLVAELETGGVSSGPGTFSIDREAARAKLQEFQLGDPGVIGLELVQAAVLRGAATIRLDADRDDLWLRFDGRPFASPELEAVFASLFLTPSDAGARSCQALAIALGASLRLGARRVTVRSGDGEGGVELVLGPDGAETLAPLARGAAVPGTEIHLKLGLVAAVTSPLPGIAERVSARSRFVDPAVIVNGTRVSAGIRPPGWVKAVPVEGAGLRGTCAILPELAGETRLWLLTDGVCIAEQALPLGTPGLAAVVESVRFSKDLSRAALVEDDALDAALDAVTEAEERVLEHLASALARGEPLPDPVRSAAHAALRHRLRTFDRLADLAPGGAAHAVAIAPVWPSVAGGFTDLATLAARIAADQPVDYADLGLGTDDRPGFDPTHCLDLGRIPDPADRRFLDGLLRDHLRCRTEELLEA